MKAAGVSFHKPSKSSLSRCVSAGLRKMEFSCSYFEQIQKRRVYRCLLKESVRPNQEHIYLGGRIMLVYQLNQLTTPRIKEILKQRNDKDAGLLLVFSSSICHPVYIFQHETSLITECSLSRWTAGPFLDSTLDPHIVIMCHLITTGQMSGGLRVIDFLWGNAL